MTSASPITIADAVQARKRIGARLSPTPLRRYPALDDEVGYGLRVWVKHENHQPTQSFKVRNALSALTALPESARVKGVVAASRGNHGAALAWAGAQLGVPVVVCVPLGNSAEKNAAMRAWGAEVVEEGGDYDTAIGVADRLVRDRGLTLVHSTNHVPVIAGAATMTLELLEQAPALDALVLAVGGGSQAVGALAVARAMRPGLRVYGVQAEGASCIHDSWHAGRPLPGGAASTFADGLATRSTYELTFEALRQGLTGFVKVSDGAIAEAVRLYLRTTHNLAEGAGAAGLAGLLALREGLAGQEVAVCLSGGNLDAEVLRKILAREL